MPKLKPVRVSIFDKDYQVNCSESEVSALKQSALFLDEKMREMKRHSNIFGLDRLAVMAALNLTNDLLTQSEKANQLDSKQSEVFSILSAQDSNIQKLQTKVEIALTRLKTKS